MNPSTPSMCLVLALTTCLTWTVLAGCEEGTTTSSEPTVCRQGASDLCGDGCAPAYEKIELGADCCACKPTTCEDVQCTTPQCGAGETVALPSDSCCPACVPEVGSCSSDSHFICSAFTCADGYIPVPGQGDCCSHCTGDETYCAAEADAYITHLQSLLTEEVTACTEDTDCAFLPSSNQCKSACFGSGVNTAHLDELTTTLNTYAEEHCSQCPWLPMTCAAIAMTPTCDQGTCR